MAWLQTQISTGADLQDFDNQKKAKIDTNVIVDRTKPIHDTITKNSLSFFKSPKRKVKSKQLVVQRNNTSLFGHRYIANQQREGDPAIFSSHENQVVLLLFQNLARFSLARSQFSLAAQTSVISHHILSLIPKCLMVQL